MISPLTSSAKVNRSQHLGHLGGHLGTPGDSVTELRPEVLFFFTLPSLASLTSLPHFLLLMVVVCEADLETLMLFVSQFVSDNVENDGDRMTGVIE